MKFTGPGCPVRVRVMLKKIALVLLAVLTLSVGFVAVKFIIPTIMPIAATATII